ncbi:MAG: aminomethyl-transferring glycine dehydrogenase subunit GcvPA [Spirochaetia bacterium]|nr:aminomethyl-transferring glycine dehydrogenase subunit GcvPA [Spirochaetia bacterium]
MAYLSTDKAAILSELEIQGIDDLFAHIPAEVRKHPGVNFPVSSELELIREAKQNASKVFSGVSFSGYGIYEHEIPAAVHHVSTNRNFVTSYTPYQPEVAQGTLQALFEYQSLMAMLTSMDIVNASMYDSATALAEAIRMDLRTKPGKTGAKNLVLLSEGIYPYILEVVQTYFPENVKKEFNIEFEMVKLDSRTGSTRWEKVTNLKNARAVVVMNPTRWGTLEKELSEIKKINPEITLMYGVCEALSLSVLDAPSESGTDIVWGDGQSLGIPVSFGGPGLGFLAVKNEFMRQMPGRFIGKTFAKNRDGETVDSYVITLSTREQHIRREKATSNICSNQSLMALRAAAYMAFMGWEGMQKQAQVCRQNAEYFKENILKKGIKLLFPEGDYFHEVSWMSPDAPKVMDAGFREGICAGVSENGVIVSYFSELTNKDEIDRLLGLAHQDI